MGVGGWVEGGWSWLGILVWVFSSDTAPRSGGGIYLSRTPRAQIRPLYQDRYPRTETLLLAPNLPPIRLFVPLGHGHGLSRAWR